MASAAFSVLRFLEDHDHDHGEEDHLDEFEESHEDEYYAESADSSKPWGDVIAASFIIMLATFSGVILISVVGCCGRLTKNGRLSSSFWDTVHRLAIPSFAAGALLATVVFLLIPESINLLVQASETEYHESHEGERLLEEERHEEHTESYHWQFGAAILGGFLFPIFMGILFPPPELDDCEACRVRAQEERLKRSMIATQSGLDGIEEEDAKALKEEGGCDEHECGGLGCSFRTEEPHSEEYHSDDEDDAERDAEKGKAQAAVGEEKVEEEEEQAKEKEEEVSVAESIPSQEHRSVNWTLVTSILVGDAFHNFTDGVFLGNAFLLCSRDVAYTIAAVTVFHELAQEIADFALLTHHCGLSTRTALILNFFAGFSVMFGALLVLAIDMTPLATGILLAISAGVYMHISAVECIPRVQLARKTAKQTLLFLLCFTCGAVPIGLVLLNHGHCEAEGEHEEH